MGLAAIRQPQHRRRSHSSAVTRAGIGKLLGVPVVATRVWLQADTWPPCIDRPAGWNVRPVSANAGAVTGGDRQPRPVHFAAAVSEPRLANLIPSRDYVLAEAPAPPHPTPRPRRANGPIWAAGSGSAASKGMVMEPPASPADAAQAAAQNRPICAAISPKGRQGCGCATASGATGPWHTTMSRGSWTMARPPASRIARSPAAP
jgi:hypothetical protein